MSEIRPPRRRVAGERARTRRPQTEPAVEGQPDEQSDEQSSRGPAPAVPTVPAPAPAEPTAAEPTADDDTTTEPERSRTRGWPFLVAAVLAALLVAGLATAAVLYYRVQESEDAASARREAVAAARSHAQSILSYDHRSLDANFARAEKVLTGTFKRDYARTTSTVVRPSAEQYKVVVKAEVTATSVIRATATRAVVLLYVDQTTTSTRLEGPKVDLNRVRMTLVEDDGQWLVSELDAL